MPKQQKPEPMHPEAKARSKSRSSSTVMPQGPAIHPETKARSKSRSSSSSSSGSGSSSGSSSAHPEDLARARSSAVRAAEAKKKAENKALWEKQVRTAMHPEMLARKRGAGQAKGAEIPLKALPEVPDESVIESKKEEAVQILKQAINAAEQEFRAAITRAEQIPPMGRVDLRPTSPEVRADTAAQTNAKLLEPAQGFSKSIDRAAKACASAIYQNAHKAQPDLSISPETRAQMKYEATVKRDASAEVFCKTIESALKNLSLEEELEGAVQVFLNSIEEPTSTRASKPTGGR